MDVSLALDALVPAASYSGSLTENNRKAFDAVLWGDPRVKPSWSDMVAWTPPAPSPYQPLAPYQFWTAVRATGQEGALRDWAIALENPLERAAATSMLEFSKEYRFDHPFMDAAREAIDLPLSEFEALWLWAMTL